MPQKTLAIKNYSYCLLFGLTLKSKEAQFAFYYWEHSLVFKTRTQTRLTMNSNFSQCPFHYFLSDILRGIFTSAGSRILRTSQNCTFPVKPSIMHEKSYFLSVDKIYCKHPAKKVSSTSLGYATPPAAFLPSLIVIGQTSSSCHST